MANPPAQPYPAQQPTPPPPAPVQSQPPAVITAQQPPPQPKPQATATPRVVKSENPPPANSTAPSTSTVSQNADLPYAKPVPGKPGYVFSPFDKNGGYVDVTGYSPGQKVKDPYSGKIFLCRDVGAFLLQSAALRVVEPCSQHFAERSVYSFSSSAFTRSKSFPSRRTQASCSFASFNGTVGVAHQVPPCRLFETPLCAPIIVPSSISMWPMIPA